VAIRTTGASKFKNKKLLKGRRYGPGRPTLDDLQKRKERILDTAYDLFIERGYAETSLVDVARQSGVATRTIYQHYGDKADIFKAVIDERTILPHIDAPAIDTDRDLPELLLDIAHYVCAVAFSKEAISYQRLMIAESNRFPELMRGVFEGLYNRFHSTVAAAFEELAKAGKIPQHDHLQTTKFFIDLLLGAVPLHLTMNWITAPPPESELRAKVALFIAGRFSPMALSASYAPVKFKSVAAPAKAKVGAQK
jgi:AcrR family transcriptional regulator